MNIPFLQSPVFMNVLNSFCGITPANLICDLIIRGNKPVNLGCCRHLSDVSVLGEGALSHYRKCIHVENMKQFI